MSYKTQAFLRRARDDSGMAGSCQQDREAIQPIHGAQRGRPDQESVWVRCPPGAVPEGLRPLFFGGKSVSQFRRDMKSTLRKLGIKEKSPHSCRHTFSRLFESYGVREADVGHSFGNDITNGVYGYRTLEALRTTIKKIKVPGTSLGRGAGILVVEVRIPAFCFLQDCDTSDSVVKSNYPENGR